MAAARPLERLMMEARPLGRWLVLLPAHALRPPIALAEALEVWLLERQAYRKREGVEVERRGLVHQFLPASRPSDAQLRDRV